MTTRHGTDAYTLRVTEIKEPPKTLGEILRSIGPSLILTANIVGSGELIMTTTLGAKAGFVTLWIILVSCLVKVTVQLEFGKHAINTGEPSLKAFNALPGPRYRGVSWSIWAWFGFKAVQLVQFGGIVGGVALAMNMAAPALDVWVWACVAALATALLVFKSHYRWIERVAVVLVAAFSAFTLLCVVLLQTTAYRITLADLAEGFSFQLPAAAVGVALGAFGLTGVSADEITAYPYWCLEKGYARFTGPHDGSADWVRRARGWIRVMQLDAVLSMVIYTLTTAAFYALGAAVLHGRGQVPEGYDMIRTLSHMYTESVGPGAMAIFLAGAVVVLFSTMFVACASGTRMFTDAFAQLGLLDYFNPRQRARWITGLAWFLPAAWTSLFLTVRAPVIMVMAGGIALAILLILVVFAALNFRYRRLSSDLRPGRIYDVLLWISCTAIAAVGVVAVVNLY